jgi:hypothetical protein
MVHQETKTAAGEDIEVGKAGEKSPVEGAVSPAAQQEGQERQIDQQIATVEQRVSDAKAEGIDVNVPTSTDVDKKDKVPEPGLWASFTAGLSSLGDWFKEKGKKIEDWVKKVFGFAPTEEKKQEQAKPDVPGQVQVKSWDEVKAIPDLGQRVYQAALFAYSTGLDCFTKDGNHCSGWCDSVFEKAGLDLYKESARIYVGDYKGWKPRGSLTGLELKPGDSVIRHNGFTSTGDHQDIILSSQGPDPDGNYQVKTVGQLSVRGTSGDREIRSSTIKAKDIKVVVRPTA